MYLITAIIGTFTCWEAYFIDSDFNYSFWKVFAIVGYTFKAF